MTKETVRVRGGTPPGPRLPALVQTALLIRDPVGFLRRCRSRYGSVFRVKVVSEPRLAYVSDPDAARQVLSSDRDIGAAGEARRDFLEPLVGERSLLCLEGEEWLRQRQLLGPAFHGQRVERYRQEIAEITTAEIERWPRGSPFPLRPRMQAITLEVILRVVFGIRDAERLRRLRELIPPLLEGSHWLMIWALPVSSRRRVESSRLLRLVPGNPLARFQRQRAVLDSMLYDEILRRQQDERADAEDVLGLLLEARDKDGAPLQDNELRDELVTLLTAGHETTATALSWAFERLLRSPVVLARLREQLERGDDEYLDAVVKETLRARPVVLDAPRLLTAPLRLDGYQIPAGWLVAPAIPLVHEEPGAFTEPDDFRPERFLGGGASYEAWIPFGGGRRRCLGSHLAMLEMKTVISSVLARAELSAVDPEPERQRLRHVTLVPSDLTTVVAH